MKKAMPIAIAYTHIGSKTEIVRSEVKAKAPVVTPPLGRPRIAIVRPPAKQPMSMSG